MGRPLVSVIIPTYNRAYCIAATIDSALTQSYQNVEIVIVDDGSKDDTAKLIAERYGNETRVKYHYKQNGGAASAKNVGMTLVTGEYVAILDSDDLWLPWKLELQMAWMLRNPTIGMTWTDMIAIDSAGKERSPAYLRTMYHAWRLYTPEGLFGKGTKISELAAGHGGSLGTEISAGRLNGEAMCYPAGVIFSQMIMGCLVHTSTVVMTRERAEKVKTWNVEYTPLGEDYDFYLRVCREGPVGFIDLPTIYYQTGNPDQMTHPRLRVHTAVNCLKTIGPLINGGAAIDLPRNVLTRRLSDVHEWVAHAMLSNGDRAGCRSHAMAAVKRYPWKLARWKLLIAGSLPAELVNRARRLKNWRHTAGLVLLIKALTMAFDTGASIVLENV